MRAPRIRRRTSTRRDSDFSIKRGDVPKSNIDYMSNIQSYASIRNANYDQKVIAICKE